MHRRGFLKRIFAAFGLAFITSRVAASRSLMIEKFGPKSKYECENFHPHEDVFTQISVVTCTEYDAFGLITITQRGDGRIKESLRSSSEFARMLDDAIFSITKPVPDGFLRNYCRQIEMFGPYCHFTITDRQIERTGG